MNRAQFRKEILQKRLQLDEERLIAIEDKIFPFLVDMDWYRNAKYIHCFYGITSKGEVPTRKILSHIITSGKMLVMPRMTGATGTLEHIRVSDPGRLSKGKWGIMEPESGTTVPSGSIDLVIVPGLAADTYGNRMGYGKGYYDRFLSRLNHGRSVMILPDEFILDHVPVQPHDIPVDALVSESGIIYCDEYHD